jgi:hypothetical protein
VARHDEGEDEPPAADQRAEQTERFARPVPAGAS